MHCTLLHICAIGSDRTLCLIGGRFSNRTVPPSHPHFIDPNVCATCALCVHSQVLGAIRFPTAQQLVALGLPNAGNTIHGRVCNHTVLFWQPHLYERPRLIFESGCNTTSYSTTCCHCVSAAEPLPERYFCVNVYQKITVRHQSVSYDKHYLSSNQNTPFGDWIAIQSGSSTNLRF